MCRRVVTTSSFHFLNVVDGFDTDPVFKYWQYTTRTKLGKYQSMAAMEIICTGDVKTLCRPCVDCGLITGRFCDHCYASDRMPTERWSPGQLTPLCSKCDNKHDSCHFCRGQKWCMPFPRGARPPEPAAWPKFWSSTADRWNCKCSTGMIVENWVDQCGLLSATTTIVCEYVFLRVTQKYMSLYQELLHILYLRLGSWIREWIPFCYLI